MGLTMKLHCFSMATTSQESKLKSRCGGGSTQSHSSAVTAYIDFLIYKDLGKAFYIDENYENNQQQRNKLL
jgi:hypothetical protein